MLFIERMVITMKFSGRRLKQLRKEMKISHEGVVHLLYADDFVVSKQSVINWEAGEHSPNLEALAHLARVFNNPIEYFIERNSNETSKV